MSKRDPKSHRSSHRECHEGKPSTKSSDQKPHRPAAGSEYNDASSSQNSSRHSSSSSHSSHSGRVKSHDIFSPSSLMTTVMTFTNPNRSWSAPTGGQDRR